MFDFLKNLTKSDEEKRKEAFSAYLDNTLSPSQRQEFEALLAEDDDLRAEMELAQLIRQQMNEMPRRSVPRSFTLDPNVYGVPKKEPLVQAYPLLRTATVMTAFFFVIALGLSVFTTQGGGDMATFSQTALESAPAMDAPMAEAEIAMEEVAEEAVEEAIEAEMAPEEPMEEGEAIESPAEAMPLPTMTAALTKSADGEILEEETLELDEAGNAAPMEESAAEPMPDSPAAGGLEPAPTPTLMPTATVSSLPRPDATETAVPRVVAPTNVPEDELANAIEIEEETFEDEASTFLTQPTQQTDRSLTTSQIVLIGLGVLLLILVIVTLLTRRRL